MVVVDLGCGFGVLDRIRRPMPRGKRFVDEDVLPTDLGPFRHLRARRDRRDVCRLSWTGVQLGDQDVARMAQHGVLIAARGVADDEFVAVVGGEAKPHVRPVPAQPILAERRNKRIGHVAEDGNARNERAGEAESCGHVVAVNAVFGGLRVVASSGCVDEHELIPLSRLGRVAT